MCDHNDTNRYIVCCSQRDYCNDLDAYSKSIREAMLLPLSKNSELTKDEREFSNHRRDAFVDPSDLIVRPPSRKVTIAIFIITGVVILMIALIGMCLFIYFRQAKKQGKEKDHQKVPTYGNVEIKKTFIQRLLKNLSLRNHSLDDDRERRNPEDQSLVGLLDISISTLGPGKMISFVVNDRKRRTMISSSFAIADATDACSTNHLGRIDRCRSIRQCSPRQLA